MSIVQCLLNRRTRCLERKLNETIHFVQELHLLEHKSKMQDSFFFKKNICIDIRSTKKKQKEKSILKNQITCKEEKTVTVAVK